MQQIPLLGSIIRDVRNYYSEQESQQRFEKIENYVLANKNIIEENIGLLNKNSKNLNNFRTIINNKFVTIDSKMDGILDLISQENINNKLSDILKEIKEMEERLIEMHGKDYKNKLSNKMTALFFELDHNIELYNMIVNAVILSKKSRPVKGKKKINIPAYKPRVASIETFLSENWLNEPKILDLLTQVHDMTMGVETALQRFFSSQNGELLDELFRLSKSADEISYKAILNLGFYWRGKFTGTFPNYKREINKKYTCPKCGGQNEIFPSPGIIQLFCIRCQRPVPLNTHYCPNCNKRQPIIPEYLDVQFEPLELECNTCHKKINIKNEELKQVYRDLK